MKKKHLLCLLVLVFIVSCATTPVPETSEQQYQERPYNFKAISLLETIFYNYENQNYFQLRNLFAGAVLDRYNMIQSSIREEFRRYDYVKVTFNIEKIDIADEYIHVRFNWRKNRRTISSGSFDSPASDLRGFSIFTFDVNNDKLVQVSGDFVFGLSGN